MLNLIDTFGQNELVFKQLNLAYTTSLISDFKPAMGQTLQTN